MFEKPLNPVLGETYQAKSPDGGMVYMEQTCHHPPISHFLAEGPEGRYRVSGYSECVVKFSVTSINVTLLGHKQVELPRPPPHKLLVVLFSTAGASAATMVLLSRC